MAHATTRNCWKATRRGLGTTRDAWSDIYGLRHGKGGQMDREATFGSKGESNAFGGVSLMNTGPKDHSRHRRALGHAFTESALREQEPLIAEYADRLIARLQERVDQEVDLTDWINWVTLDIIGDLTFGNTFTSIDKAEYHPWARMIAAVTRSDPIIRGLRFAWGSVEELIANAIFLPSGLVELSKQGIDMTMAMVKRRVEMESDRRDFIHYLQRNKSDKALISHGELQADCQVLMLAGSDTTGSLLTATIYFLIRNQRAMAKAVHEVRSAFKSEDEINYQSASQLLYLKAVLEEVTRIHPPQAFPLWRKVPDVGAVIAGKSIPSGTYVCCPQYSICRSTRNFKDALSFVPERWLGDELYPDDNHNVYNPFSFGPRTCLGKNLALLESRLIATRLLWNFDFEMNPKSVGWENQKAYGLWERPPLMVKLISTGLPTNN